MEVVKTICEACPISCGLEVHVRDGRAVRLHNRQDHLHKKLCPKGGAFLEVQYHPDRLLHPLRRTKAGSFERVSWDTALDIIVERLERLRRNGRPEALLLHYGDAVGLRETRHIPRWFARAFGSPNYASGAPFCHFGNVIGMTLTYGHFTLPRFAGTRCAVFWGHNPHESDPPAVDGYRHARKSGARLLVIDPRRTRVASEADLHVALRPGTDGALALGMLHVVINEELYDRDFVRDWTVGFPELREHVQKYPPGRMARICGVSSDTIVEAARMFAANRPAAVLLVAAAEHHSNGVQTVRAIASLIAMCGSFDVAGGNTYVDRLPLREPELPAESFSAWRIGREEYPIYTEIVDECQPMPLLDENQPRRIEAFVMQGVNPVATWPNARRVREVLRALDLTVVMDLFMTETAEAADLILPAATCLERAELIDYGYFQAAPYLDVTRQVLEPPGECWPDWKLWLALAQRLGLDRRMPWRTLDEVIEFQLGGTDYTLAGLREHGRGFFYRPRAERRYLTEGFATPSGKVELYSRRLAEVGQPPLPSLSREEEERGATTADPDYPFLFTTGGREMGYTHSQFHGLRKMNAISPGPLCEINAKDAARLAIEDAAWVEIESAAGKARARARVTDRILMGVVHLPHGWPGPANANLLTDHCRRDPVSGLPAFKDGRCAVRPAPA